MQCVTCKAEISSVFRYAIVKNECPACGGSIMDEESLAIIEHLKHTLSNVATLRDETVQGLAMTLFSTYEISLRNDVRPASVVVQPIIEQPRQDVKIAPSSTMNKILKKGANKENIVMAEEVLQEGISDAERDEIMEEAVKKRYCMVESVQMDLPSEDNHDNTVTAMVGQNDSVFSEGNVNPILEQDRLARLAKQRQAIEGGSGVFRRSSD
jgi:hypothetical protein